MSSKSGQIKSSGNEVLKELHPFLLPPVAPRLLVSTVVTAVGFQGSCRAGSGVLEKDALKHHRAHCLYQDSAKFLKINAP